ncbi:unnamed protein product [Symbiodinium pilosum]|uniref:Uncharacterized protein n=1 Tax=Symbiodinium pilosum TaxID=2952 RepID=A0A812W6U1_SYMPI|nr:unnamed protein product [Symbiodinium pilosum]
MEPDGSSEAEGRAAFSIFEQRRAQLQASVVRDRGVIYFASPRTAADAFPPRSMDLALVDFRGCSAELVQERFALWESKVKPGGILLGVGFAPTFPEIVTAVCAQRFSTDLHIGTGGGFWWLVEPPEEE